MKLIRFLLLVLMILFAAVQYNDPDGWWWVLIYGTVAGVLAVSLWRPGWFGQQIGRTLLWVLLASLLVGVWWYWPSDAGFWRKEVWWEEETAREGMGMMICLLVSLVALPLAFTGKSTGQSQGESIR